MDADVALARYAADRLAIVSRAECRAIGLTDDQVDWRVSNGLLVPVHPGVFRHAAAPETYEGLVRAAVLACDGRAYASGPSFARLFGIRGEWSDAVEVTVVGASRPRLRGVRVRRIDALGPGDTQRRFGIPVLAPPVGLLLLGDSAPPWKVETAVHDMVFQRLTTRARLLDGLATYGGRGRRGTTSLRSGIRSLDASGSGTQTNFELDALRLVRLHGLGTPVLQHRVGTYRLDLAWVREQLDVELDGDRWHLHVADRARDRARDTALRALGWDVLRFGTADIHVRTAATVAQIRRSLAHSPDDVRSSGQRTGVA